MKTRIPTILIPMVSLCCVALEAAPAPSPYPVKLSANGRYIVDQNNQPFLIVGDTPQGLMGRLTDQEADWYFANRQSHGFKPMGWVDVTCAGPDYPTNKNATTINGVRPFTGYVTGGTDFAVAESCFRPGSCDCQRWPGNAWRSANPGKQE